MLWIDSEKEFTFCELQHHVIIQLNMKDGYWRACKPFEVFDLKKYIVWRKLMDKFVLRLDKAIDAIDKADYVLIGAGAGFSAAAGLEYSGKRFDDNFKDCQ